MQNFKRTAAAIAITLLAVSVIGVLVTPASHAQSNNQGGDAAIKEIEKYRQALGDGNPAELWEARGEGIWKKPRGPKKA